jgi:hypothetical protein
LVTFLRNGRKVTNTPLSRRKKKEINLGNAKSDGEDNREEKE